MSIAITMDDNLKDLKVFLNELGAKAVVTSTRQSLNRTISSLRTKTNSTIRERIKLKAGEINRRFLKVDKAQGNNLNKLSSRLGASSDPISLLRLVAGQKTPRKQKGIAVAKRKPIRVEIRPGQRRRLKSAFIATGRGAKNQVFRRQTKRRRPIAKQSIPSVAILFARDSFRLPLEKFAQGRYLTEFNAAFANALRNAQQKSSRTRL